MIEEGPEWIAHQKTRSHRRLAAKIKGSNGILTIACSVCTLQEDRPVMIEEGPEWIAHQKTQSHRRLAAKIKCSNGIRSDHLTSSEEGLGVEDKWQVDDS